MSHFQIVNIHIPMMIYWTPKKFNKNMHPQEFVYGHV